MDDKQHYALLTNRWTHLHVPNCFILKIPRRQRTLPSLITFVLKMRKKKNSKGLSAWAAIASDPCKEGCLFLQVASVQFD